MPLLLCFSNKKVLIEASVVAVNPPQVISREDDIQYRIFGQLLFELSIVH